MAFKDEEIGKGDLEAILYLLAQISWMVAFVYDNKIFLARTQIVRLNEQANFRGFTQWWTAADVFTLLNVLFTLKRLIKEKQNINSSEINGRFDSRTVTDVADRLDQINKEIKFATFRLIKCVMNLLVSGEFSGLWKILFGGRLDPGTQGLFGMISGLMGVYEEMCYLKGDDKRVTSVDASLKKIFDFKEKEK